MLLYAHLQDEVSKPLTYRENKCEFPCATLILAIETRITDSETKPLMFAYDCFFPFLCPYLFTNYIIWGWILALFLTTCKSQHNKDLVYEWTEKYHIVKSVILGLPVAEARINIGQQISSTKYFLYSGSRSKGPDSLGRDPLSVLFFD